jgi:hypothetical protein
MKKEAKVVEVKEPVKFADLEEIESLKAANLFQQGMILEQAIGLAQRDLQKAQSDLRAVETVRNQFIKGLGDKYMPGVQQIGITPDGKKLVNIELIEAEEAAKKTAEVPQSEGTETVN